MSRTEAIDGLRLLIPFGAANASILTTYIPEGSDEASTSRVNDPAPLELASIGGKTDLPRISNTPIVPARDSSDFHEIVNEAFVGFGNALITRTGSGSGEETANCCTDVRTTPPFR